MYGVSEGPIRHWSSSVVHATIAAGLILLAVLVLTELRKRQPLIDIRLLGNRLFRSCNGVMVLASASFIGTLYVVSLFFQDGRGLSALGSGLSTFPEALGVMAGAQLTSRVLYPVLGPRRNIALGLLGVTASIGLMSLVGAQTSLWWMRLLMFCLGVAMGQVFVPAQAAAFATISPEATGRASTMFNVVRQLGSAFGVALFTMTETTSRPADITWRESGRYEDIRYETTDDGIAKITICRPDVHNAFRPQTHRDLACPG